MLIRMCPLCDHEMKKRHHCDVCGSFIWKPEMVDIHLNEETRGLNEENCAYPESEAHVHQNHGNTYKSVKKEKVSNTHYGAAGGQSIYTHHRAASKNIHSNGSWHKETFQTKGQEKNSSKTAVTWVVVIVIIFSVITALAPIIKNLDIIDTVKDFIEDEDLELFKGKEEDDVDFEERSLTHEEVMAEGQPCNGYGHIAVNGSIVCEKMMEFSLSEGYILTDNHDISEQNTIYPWEDGETRYFSVRENYWDRDFKINITVQYDSYNDELHSIFMTFEDREAAKAHLEYALQILETSDIDTGRWTDEDTENALTFDGDKDYQFIDVGVIEVYTSISEYDDEVNYVIEVSAQ